jgi:predicted dehydrogenase
MGTSEQNLGVPDPTDAPGLRWGILGPGGIARPFVDEVQRHTKSKTVVVGYGDLGRAERFAAQFGIKRAHGPYGQLVSDPDIDAIYIATPNSRHHRHALMALAAGEPVLVEKPFALNAAQAREVFDLARRQYLFVMEAMWSRCLPHYAKLRQLTASGDLGEPLTALADHQQSLALADGSRLTDPTLGGGALLDLGVYPPSLFHMLLGPPDQVTAVGSPAASGVDLNEAVIPRYGARTLAVALSDSGATGLTGFSLVGTKPASTLTIGSTSPTTSH